MAELSEWAPPPLDRAAGFREASDAADVESLVQAMGEEGDLVQERLRRGCRAFLLRRGSEVAAYGWLTAGPEWIGEIGLEIVPGADEAYLWNCVTLPEHRLQGLFKRLVVHVAAAVKEEGYARLWIAGLAGTAERALEYASFRRIAEITPMAERAGWFQVEPAGVPVLGLGDASTFAAGAPRRH